jgi:hypothetical protein
MAKTRPPYTPRVPAPDGRIGTRRPLTRGTGAGVRIDGAVKKNWVAQAERDAGRSDGGLTTVEREELTRLRREASPPGGPKAGPSLTVAARDGRTFEWAGTGEWLRRGRTKESCEGGQHDVRSDTLILSPHLSTKPGQV